MNKPGKKILCVGLCCLDIVMYCDSYPLEDTDHRCSSHRWQRGGNASNNCTILAEFKFPCEFFGTMSTDIGGQFMKKDFEEWGIPIENCRFYEEYESPISTIWINLQNGSRTIVHSNNNMPEVSFEDFKRLDLNNYSWIHFECRPYYEDIKKMIQHVREWNSEEGNDPIKISLEIEKPRKELKELLNLGDIVFISKEFASACSYSDMVCAIACCCRQLREGGIVVCAWGDKGACARGNRGSVVNSVAFPPAKMVSTLGAGDTFVAATIMSLYRGRSLGESVNTGCKVAGAKCGMVDSKGLAKLFPFLTYN